MKYIKTYTDFENVNESWLHNILTAISLFGGVALPTLSKANTKPISNIEQSINKNEKVFFSACLQFCQELSQETTDIEQRSSLLEAKLYFQSKRDGKNPDELSENAKVVVKSVEMTILQMSKDKLESLSKKGQTAKVQGEIVGL